MTAIAVFDEHRLIVELYHDYGGAGFETVADSDVYRNIEQVFQTLAYRRNYVASVFVRRNFKVVGQILYKRDKRCRRFDSFSCRLSARLVKQWVSESFKFVGNIPDFIYRAFYERVAALDVYRSFASVVFDAEIFRVIVGSAYQIERIFTFYKVESGVNRVIIVYPYE